MRPLLPLLCASALAAADAPRRPNVVLIYADDQGTAELGCYGGRVQTPRLDALAQQGVRCANYYATHPVCSPSRYAVLSGRYASRSRFYLDKFPAGTPLRLGWESGIAGEPATLGKVLQSAGYVTGFAGKWHQHGQGPENLPVDADIGKPAVAAKVAANYALVQELIRGNGFTVADGVYWQNFGLGKEFKGDSWWIPAELRFHNPEWITDAALRFLDGNKDRPFCLYIAHTLPHSPKPIESLKKGSPRASAAGMLEEAPRVQAPRKQVLARTAEAKLPENAAQSAWIDDSVGAVLDRLDRLGLAENTLVIYASDNGPAPGKFTAYELGARLPLIVRWPARLPAGRVSRELISTVDLPATIYAACGVTPPAEARLDGADRLASLAGTAPGPADVLIEIASTRAVVSADGWKYLAVRHGPEAQAEADRGVKHTQWGQKADGTEHHTYGAEKAFAHYWAKDQLFELGKDPDEKRNLAASPEARERLAALQARLKEYSARLPSSFGEFGAGATP